MPTGPINGHVTPDQQPAAEHLDDLYGERELLSWADYVAETFLRGCDERPCRPARSPAIVWQAMRRLVRGFAAVEDVPLEQLLAWISRDDCDPPPERQA